MLKASGPNPKRAECLAITVYQCIFDYSQKGTGVGRLCNESKYLAFEVNCDSIACGRQQLTKGAPQERPKRRPASRGIASRCF